MQVKTQTLKMTIVGGLRIIDSKCSNWNNVVELDRYLCS
ncbi:hypothetical protein [uncultured Gammaproteobacteria bacterium]|nr:hypothetical protein [uncultured Gammaproteobacteria bacterium]CAC9979576.1 hypothetical protein [uncultured Gammaproteobacteria bacterium]CAC9999215.1 hypothetical protein [uncultured Gammaproteobacteria bacterium]